MTSNENELIVDAIIQVPTVQYGYIQIKHLGTLEELDRINRELLKLINKKEDDII